MDKPRLNETPLPILAKIYCITLGLESHFANGR